MSWTVYCHTHVESGRRYIGLTKQTMERRWAEHVSKSKSSKGGRWHFPNAIRKYGADAFSHEVLEVCETLEGANAAEIRWIMHFKTRDPLFGFNLAEGGGVNPNAAPHNPWDRPEYRAKQAGCISRLQTPEARAKSRAGMNTPQSRAKRSAQRKGVPLSSEHCAKLSAAGKGKVVSLEARVKSSATQKGKPRNPTSIAKSAATRRGMKFDAEARANMSAAQQGRKHSPEHVAKVAAANRNRPKTATCSHGHSLEDAYVINGRRFCRICQSVRSAAYYARKRG